MTARLPAQLTLTEVAARISSHLRRFERDPEVNAGRRYDKETGEWVPDPNGTRRFFGAGAHVAGSTVQVRYISYQGVDNLTRAKALHYLAALDRGFIGSHYQLFQEDPPPEPEGPEVRYLALVRLRWGFILYAVTKRTRSRVYGQKVAGSGYAGSYVERRQVVKLQATEEDLRQVTAWEKERDQKQNEAAREFEARLASLKGESGDGGAGGGPDGGAEGGPDEGE